MPTEAPFPDADTLWVVHIGNDDRIAPEWRARYPLRQVYVPVR